MDGYIPNSVLAKSSHTCTSYPNSFSQSVSPSNFLSSEKTMSNPDDHDPGISQIPTAGSLDASSVGYWTQAWGTYGQVLSPEQNMYGAIGQCTHLAIPIMSMPVYNEFLSIYDQSASAYNHGTAHQTKKATMVGSMHQTPDSHNSASIEVLRKNETVPPLTMTDISMSTTSNTPFDSNLRIPAADSIDLSISLSFSSRNPERLKCYDHGCDGRKFSSISNLRRHQRERDGRTLLCFCHWCGSAFYRRWTRDQHVRRMRCCSKP